MRSPSPPAYIGRRARIGLLALGLVAAGCASAARSRPAPADSTPPWQIPDGALHSQSLYRVSYSGPPGEGSFKLTLRLASRERYQVMAADPLGRALWSLDVRYDEGAERGLWLDHRNKVACEFEGRFDVVGVPLAPFPLLSLPALLLGRLPAAPVGEPQRQGRSITYADELGRHWMATLDAGGLPESWSMADENGPRVFWVRRDDWSILSDRSQGAQVRWRLVLREDQPAPPEPLVAPPAYRREDCHETYPERSEGAPE